MNPKKAWIVCALPALLLAPPGQAEKLRNHFDSDKAMAEPGFFDFIVVGAPGKAEWRVMPDLNPPSAPNQLTQIVSDRPADSIAVALRRNSSFRDGSWSTDIKRTPSQAGIVFRMTGPHNFLALLIDLPGGEACLLSYRNGKPTELGRGRARLTREWGTLTIAGTGRTLAAKWDGEPLLEASDPDPAAGRSGVAAAGPGVASFDEFVLDPVELAGR